MIIFLMIVLYFMLLIDIVMFIANDKHKKPKHKITYNRFVLGSLAISYIILTPLYPQTVWYATRVAWLVNIIIFAIVFIMAISNYTPDHSTNTKIKSSSQPTKQENPQPPKPQVDPTTSFNVMKLTKTYKNLNADYLQSTWTVEDYSIMETSELVSKVEKAYKVLVLKEDPTELVKFMMVPGALIGIMSNGDALVLVQNNSLPLLYNDEKYVDVQMLSQKEIALISDIGHKLVVNV